VLHIGWSQVALPGLESIRLIADGHKQLPLDDVTDLLLRMPMGRHRSPFLKGKMYDHNLLAIV
jgi:hypothetical protein